MTAWQIRELEQLRQIPLSSILLLCGAQPDRHDKNKWHTAKGPISVTGAKFMNWNSHRGGGGAIDLVIHLLDLGFLEAVQWLCRHFPHCCSFQQPDFLSTNKPSTGSLILPTADPTNLWRVRRYLQQRRLPNDAIDTLIQTGNLYADARANAVFLLRGHNHKPVGAELRGTTPIRWRALAPGSRKDLGYFALTPSSFQSTVLVESAIDAISCFALHPEHRCISTSGARPNPLWLAELLSNHQTLYCGFDADQTGEEMADAMIAFHPTIKRFRPPFGDWNDVLVARA